MGLFKDILSTAAVVASEATSKAKEKYKAYEEACAAKEAERAAYEAALAEKEKAYFSKSLHLDPASARHFMVGFFMKDGAPYALKNKSKEELLPIRHPFFREKDDIGMNAQAYYCLFCHEQSPYLDYASKQKNIFGTSCFELQLVEPYKANYRGDAFNERFFSASYFYYNKELEEKICKFKSITDESIDNLRNTVLYKTALNNFLKSYNNKIDKKRGEFETRAEYIARTKDVEIEAWEKTSAFSDMHELNEDGQFYEVMGGYLLTLYLGMYFIHKGTGCTLNKYNADAQTYTFELDDSRFSTAKISVSVSEAEKIRDFFNENSKIEYDIAFTKPKKDINASGILRFNCVCTAMFSIADNQYSIAFKSKEPIVVYEYIDLNDVYTDDE